MGRILASVLVISFFFILALGSASPPPPQTPSYSAEWSKLKLASISPKEMTIKGDSIVLYKRSNPGSYGKRIVQYYSPDQIQIEDPNISFNIGITNTSLITMGVGETASPAVFYISISNKLNEPISVNWDSIAYVDSNGISHRVIKSGTRIADRGRPIGTVVIPPNARIEEIFQPIDGIDFEYGTWLTLPVLESVMPGGEVTVFIPITINNQVTNYSFTFLSEQPSQS